MARKGDDLLAELDQLGIEEQTAPSSNAKDTAASGPKQGPASTGDEDLFGDLKKQLAAKPSQTSRPTTPRLSSSTTSGTNKSPKRAEHTPASSGPPSGRTSEDRLRNAPAPAPARSSGEGRSYHRSTTLGEETMMTQEEEKQAEQKDGGGGGWWGSMFSAATAAVKQAETLAKEIRGNEEAQRWAEQVRGYGAGIQSLTTDLRGRALPTFTSLISHIAPPISAHERLQIHTTHDILNYPSLDPLIYSVFSRVMAQVEGGDLLVIQRGSENRSRTRTTSQPEGYRGSVLGGGGGGNGWTDGPWWRDEGVKRDLGAVMGLKEGTRLARVSAEAYAREFFDSRGGVEEAAKMATEVLNESNPVRSSDIFLAIQAVSYQNDQELFADDARAEKPTDVVDPTSADEIEELTAFAIYLHDPIHSLSFTALSQPFPRKWASWLDAASGTAAVGDGGEDRGLPDSILEIIRAGGVDPREWVAEWMEEILQLAVGVVAQCYVARRMGVGAGGLGRGKSRAEDGDGMEMSGEAARAL